MTQPQDEDRNDGRGNQEDPSFFMESFDHAVKVCIDPSASALSDLEDEIEGWSSIEYTIETVQDSSMPRNEVS